MKTMKSNNKKEEILLKDLNILKSAITGLSMGNLSSNLVVQSKPTEIDKKSKERDSDVLLNRIIQQLKEVASEFNIVTDVPCKRLCYVGADSFLEGQKCGEYFGELLKGSGQIAIIISFFGYISQELRRKGFENILKIKYPDIKIVDIVESQDKSDCQF